MNTQLVLSKGLRINSTSTILEPELDTITVNESTFNVPISPYYVSGYIKIQSIDNAIGIDQEYTIFYGKSKQENQVIATPVFPVELLIEEIKENN